MNPTGMGPDSSQPSQVTAWGRPTTSSTTSMKRLKNRQLRPRNNRLVTWPAGRLLSSSQIHTRIRAAEPPSPAMSSQSQVDIGRIVPASKCSIRPVLAVRNSAVSLILWVASMKAFKGSVLCGPSNQDFVTVGFQGRGSFKLRRDGLTTEKAVLLRGVEPCRLYLRGSNGLSMRAYGA